MPRKSEPYHVIAARQSAGNPVVVDKPDMFPEKEKVLRQALDDGLRADLKKVPGLKKN